MSTSQPFHNGVSAKVVNRAASLAAVWESCRAMEALNSNPIASGRGVHEELSRLHPQDDDNLADLLADPFSLPRIKLKLKLKLFTTCAVCAGLHQIPYAPVDVSGLSQLCHTWNLQVRARPLTT
jgi:hypothetical protein